MSCTLDRPLVFGKVPSVILNRDCVARFLTFFKTREVRFEVMRFQQNFHIIRFPALTAERVEELLDVITRRFD